MRSPSCTAALWRNISGPTTAQTRRGFFSFNGSSPDASVQSLTASRVVPYPSALLYAIIVDVDSYKNFVPYCSHSQITRWSKADPTTGQRWPTQADLHVGWGGFNECFTSQLRCVPGVSVEAMSGGDGQSNASAVFRSLLTRWSVKALGEEKTQVDVMIKYHFTSPLYAAVSAAMSDKVAGMMIEAFEKEAHSKLGRPTR
ncbi:cyclase/dehydrase family protein [Emericellopsis atlantica]|uniref:Cyclase/dehydrase family protein n=1 Tax=Emericellopsis atlantica TaxID=2614577 RepID=A0A9P7ZUH1_9HYPO|nr:cyclase/dehydrase family protein [Emericellopsis atlantica]KAG9258296.1 cyclase/dehydrase family protein [Emericellopsis atlantica]